MTSTRILDIAVASVALLCYAPVFLVAAVLIRLEDGEPLFFRQERLGKDKQPFEVLKLRTMRDGKVTRVGRWLRMTALDEFPQFIHVLRGEMGFVGPRPMTQFDVDRLGWNGECYAARWAVTPGVTGPVQVFGSGGDAEEAWRMDARYVARRCLREDLRMIVLSVVVNVAGKRRFRGWFGEGLRSA